MFPLAKFFEIFTAGDQQYMERLSYLPFSQEKIYFGGQNDYRTDRYSELAAR
jgi:hypothetical protein